MTGGSSGGPWLSSFNETTGSRHAQLAQLVRLQRHQEHVRSEVQRQHRRTCYDAANGATGNTIVP